jgi:hypothetical protein
VMLADLLPRGDGEREFVNLLERFGQRQRRRGRSANRWFPARFKHVCYTAVPSKTAPNRSFSAKPMIEVFAVWTTFSLPYRVGYLPDEFLHWSASSV